MKTYCARQVIFGRQVWILDPKPEYELLCQAVGGVYVSPRPGGDVRLNPLEALIRDRRPEAIRRARMDPMLPLTEAALGRALRPAEQTGVDGAVRLCAVAADAEGRQPTLRDVLEALFEPSQALAAHMRTPVAETRAALREAAYGLELVIGGGLGEDVGRTQELTWPRWVCWKTPTRLLSCRRPHTARLHLPGRRHHYGHDFCLTA